MYPPKTYLPCSWCKPDTILTLKYSITIFNNNIIIIIIIIIIWKNVCVVKSTLLNTQWFANLEDLLYNTMMN